MRTLTIIGLIALAGCSDHPYDPNAPAVDPNAPVVHITSPDRGFFAGDVQVVTVTGTATDDTAVASVTVNDTPATLNADGTWTAQVPVTAGTNLLHAIALDPSNNAGKESRSVVVGPTSPVSTTVPNAITAALSAQTFAALGTGAGNYIKTADLESLISSSNPVLNDGAPNGPDCLYVQGSITSMTIGDAQISLVPQTGGLALDAELSNVNVGMHLDYAAACINGSRDITIAATHISITGNMAIGVASGQFAITLDSPDVTLTGFDAELGGLTGDIVDLLDLNDAFGPLIGWATEKFVTPMINTELDALNETKTIAVLNSMVDITVTPASINFTSDGGIVELNTSIRAHGDSGAFVDVTNTAPAMDLSQGFQLAVAANAANQALTSLWSAKGLDDTLQLNNGSYGDIGTLFDSVEISAAAPPYVDASSDNGLVLTIGDLMGTFRNNGVTTTQIAINAQVDVTADVSASGVLQLNVGEPTTYVDVLDQGVSGANELSSSQFEALTSFALARVIAVASGSLGAVPLPSIGGVSVQNLSIAPQTGYLVVDGSVQ
ncbi:MAG TPA: hypothetical protein VGG74_25485 [Kofleriaceae bacterium]|jgi:hypothetical protein